MSKLVNNFIAKYIAPPLRRIPGEERFGEYRFLPLFFLVGAGLEFFMINFRVNNVDFCNISLIRNER